MGNIGYAYAHRRSDRDQAVYVSMRFYACLAGVTMNRRCINVDATIIIAITIFNNIINGWVQLALLHRQRWLSANSKLFSEGVEYVEYTNLSESKKQDNYQESIQSSTTPDPGYQWEGVNITIRLPKREPRSPFPVGDHKESTNRRA